MKRNHPDVSLVPNRWAPLAEARVVTAPGREAVLINRMMVDRQKKRNNKIYEHPKNSPSTQFKPR